MSWNDWLTTIGAYPNVDVTESAIYTTEGAVCCAGEKFKIQPAEFQAIKKAIKDCDSGQSRCINGKKFLPVGRLGDGQGNFKMGKDAYNVNVGDKYVVFLKVKSEGVVESVVSHGASLQKSLHP